MAGWSVINKLYTGQLTSTPSRIMAGQSVSDYFLYVTFSLFLTLSYHPHTPDFLF
jgi:hypothetical protein